MKNIRENDSGFRLGGDEFLVLIHTDSYKVVSDICENIQLSVTEVQGFTFYLTLSMGIAFRSEVVKNKSFFELSDQRMYKKKKFKETINIIKNSTKQLG